MARRGAPAQPALLPAHQRPQPPTLMERPRIPPELIRAELEKAREEFVAGLKAKEESRIAEIEARFKASFAADIARLEGELGRATRIINIQNAILRALYTKDRKLMMRVLKDANISAQDLKALSPQ